MPSLTAEARETIEDNYFKPVDATRARATPRSTAWSRELRKRYDDRFSHYFTPTQLRQFDAATSGRFSGVGLTVTEVKRGPARRERLPGHAGRARRDRGGRPDRRRRRRVDRRRARRRRRPRGSRARRAPTVELRVDPGRRRRARRASSSSAPTCGCRSVQGELSRVDGARSPTSASRPSARAPTASFATTVERLYRRGAEGLVLDLRGNGGGLLNEAVLSASVFLAEGERSSRPTAARQGDATTRPSATRSTRSPMVVLIDRDTASAAEILTAALGDHDLATVVGTRSFGKGVFQEVIELATGGALDLTVGEYLTADGTSLAGKGIKPDVRAPTTRRRTTGLTRRSTVLAESRRVEQVPRGAAVSARRRGRPTRGRFPSPSRCSSAAPQVAPRAGLDRGRAGRDGAGRARHAAAPGARARRSAAPRRAARRGRGAAARPRPASAASATALEAEAARRPPSRPRARRSAAPRPDRRSPPSRSTRRPRATSTTRSRPSARATASGSGSTSPTSPPTCGPARRSTARRCAAATAPTCRARSSRCCPRR